VASGQQGPTLKVPLPKSPATTLLRSFREFAGLEASSGLLLIAATLAAMIWANSPVSGTYFELWRETTLTLGPPGHELSLSLVAWVNDLLMALFFLLVGLEIKREILAGELASARKAAMPIVAAAGGMLFPGLLYAVLHVGEPTLRGWGVPVATDIAFALGVLTLVGRSTPSSLKIFLASLAIADDIGALLVIALFYTEGLRLGALLIAAGLIGILILINGLGFKSPIPYLLIGAAVWFFVHESGVHATIAGVAVAMTIPARASVAGREFVNVSREALNQFEARLDRADPIMTDGTLLSAVDAVGDACRKVTPPLQRLEQSLHPWVAFAIVPVFALANAGVLIGGSVGDLLIGRVSIGVVLGLVIGKPVGIVLASWVAVHTGVAALPSGATWRHIVGVGCLGGIGFTMSLFIANLAFLEPAVLDSAKLGVLGASLLSGILGWVILARK
jgi:NhaA family Na+:H+ antiporter